jgi:hypothetical protein
LQELKASSRKHERRIAELLGVKPTPGSGGLGIPGDVPTSWLLASCKQTEGRSCPFDLGDIEKATHDADLEQKTPLLIVEFVHAPQGVDRDWAFIPLRVLIPWLIEREHAARIELARRKTDVSDEGKETDDGKQAECTEGD